MEQILIQSGSNLDLELNMHQILTQSGSGYGSGAGSRSGAEYGSNIGLTVSYNAKITNLLMDVSHQMHPRLENTIIY